MATAYVLQTPTHTGLDLTALPLTVPSLTGDTAPTGSGIFLLVLNSAAGVVTVSLPMLSFDNVTVGPRVISVTASHLVLIPLPSSVYGTGTVAITYTGTLAGVGVAVIAVPGT